MYMYFYVYMHTHTRHICKYIYIYIYIYIYYKMYICNDLALHVCVVCYSHSGIACTRLNLLIHRYDVCVCMFTYMYTRHKYESIYNLSRLFRVVIVILVVLSRALAQIYRCAGRICVLSVASFYSPVCLKETPSVLPPPHTRKRTS